MTSHIFDVIVIGAGQAALSMGYYLKQTNLTYVLIGKEERVGDIWRNRYDSLVLFTPRWFSSLPGMRMKGDPHSYAAKDEIADYLENYAKHFELPIQLNEDVKMVKKQEDTFIVMTNNQTYTAKQVVVAAGPFQKPKVPEFASRLSASVFQIHTTEYKNAEQLEDGSTLIVGGGNSGAQIAAELSGSRDVYLSVGHRMKFLPLELFGKSIFWWFENLGLYKATIHTRLGKRLRQQSDPIFGRELKDGLKSGKVRLRARAVHAQDHLVHFEDGTSLGVQNVIWATGFISDYSWIHIPNIFDRDQRVIHYRGVSCVQGLYFLGLPWQHHRGSALIGGVGNDAKYLIEKMITRNEDRN